MSVRDKQVIRLCQLAPKAVVKRTQPSSLSAAANRFSLMSAFHHYQLPFSPGFASMLSSATIADHSSASVTSQSCNEDDSDREYVGVFTVP